MTHEEWIEIGALALGAFAIYMILSRGGSPVATPAEPPTPDVGPEYLTYNYPRTEAASDLALPTVTSPASEAMGGNSPAPTCGCTTGTQAMFSAPSALSDYLTQSVENLADTYSNNILSSMPDFFRQYVNNPQGAREFTTSVGQLTAYSAP